MIPEPSSRPLTVVQDLLPDRDFEFLSLMQKAFYVEGKDINDSDVLRDWPEKLALISESFRRCFIQMNISEKQTRGFSLAGN